MSVLPKDIQDVPNIGNALLLSNTLVYNGYIIGGDQSPVRKASIAPGTNEVTFSEAHPSRYMSNFYLHLPEINVRSRVIYDRSGRKIENVEYTINFRTFLLRRSVSNNQRGTRYTDNGTHDQDVQDIINILSDTSDSVRFPHGLGSTIVFGDIHTVRPQSVNIVPSGISGSLRLEWNLVVIASNSNFDDRWEGESLSSDEDQNWTGNTRNPGESVPAPLYNIKSLTWGVTHSLDSGGLVTRTLSGRCTTFASRDREIHADWLRRSIVVFRPDWFRPISQTFNVSEDKTVLTFTIVDQEFRGTPYPVGVEFADGNFSLDIVEPKTSRQGIISMQVMYKLMPGYNHDTANFHFFLAVARAQQTVLEQLKGAQGDYAFLPEAFHIDRGLYESSRIWKAGIRWFAMGCIKDLLFNNKFWDPLGDEQFNRNDTPDDRAKNWATSTRNAGIADPWGHRGWFSTPDDDYKQPNEVPPYYQTTSEAIGLESSWSGAQFGGSVYNYVYPEITPENSWLTYDVKVKTAWTPYKVWHRKAVAHTPVLDAEEGDTEDPAQISGYDTPNSPSDTGEEDHVREFRGKPVTYVQVSFVGIRVKYKPTKAPLLSLNGGDLTPVPDAHRSHSEEIGRIANQPVFLVKHVTLYTTTSHPGSISPYSRDKTSLCVDTNLVPNYKPKDGDQ